MLIRFKATARKKTHLADDARFFDGNIKDVPTYRGMKLLETYKDNFFEVDIPSLPQKKTIKLIVSPQKKIKSIIPVSKPEYTEPKHKPLTLADISVVVLNPYPDVFKTHLLPCIPEEVEFIPLENINNVNWTSGAKALNYGIGVASNDIVICAHPDLVLGKKWFDSFIYHEARLENWGALGVVGWDFRNRMTWGNEVLSPYKIQCLDECCIVVSRKNRIWFDERTFKSWHCFASDFCLNCIYNKGLDVYVMPGVASHEGYSFKTVSHFMKERNDFLPLLWEKWKNKVPRINMGLKESMFTGEK